MRALVANGYGGPEVLTVTEAPRPTPKAKEVLVEMKATSLNALDWHFLTGTPYLMRIISGLRHPKIPIRGADISGTIVEVGADVADYKVGDDVFGESRGGGCAEFATIATKHIARKPAAVSFEDAAATPVAGVTALQALRTHGKVREGERVLINGGAGGVGTFAVQIAKALGAEVTAVTSSRNVDMVKRLGADRVIDYTSEDFVQTFTTNGGERFDVLADNVGNRTAAECISVLEPNGRCVSIAGPKENDWTGPMTYIVQSVLGFRKASQSFHQFTAKPNNADLAYLGELLANGQVVPEIDRVVGLEGAIEGLAEVGTGHTRAKIVVVPTQAE